MQDAFIATLSLTLRSAGINPDSQLLKRLSDHWSLLTKWAPRLNLTAVDDPEEAASVHYRDSLEGLLVVPPGPLVDIGSGAGFPGLVLAAADPARKVTLVEPRRKRASFLRVAAAALGLPNVSVLETRADSLPNDTFHVAVTRATFSTYQELAPCLGWIRPAGVLVAYRTEPLESPVPTTVHAYEIQRRARVLQIWRR